MFWFDLAQVTQDRLSKMTILHFMHSCKNQYCENNVNILFFLIKLKFMQSQS